MKLLKSLIIAFSFILSLLSFSASVIAAGPPTAESGLKGIKIVLSHVGEAKKAIDAGEDNDAIKNHIRAALRASKEVTGTERLEKRRLKYSRLLKKARSALKDGDTEKTKDFLTETEEKFESLKKLL